MHTTTVQEKRRFIGFWEKYIRLSLLFLTRKLYAKVIIDHDVDRGVY